jgi:Xaa-Pro aminopeptidase
MLNGIKKIQPLSGVDAILITTPENVQYLSNFSGSHKKMLISKKSMMLFTDDRYALRAQKEVPKASGIIIKTQNDDFKNEVKKYKTIGFEPENMTVKNLQKLESQFPKIKWKAIDSPIEKLRRQKTPDEIKKIQKSCSILD